MPKDLSDADYLSQEDVRALRTSVRTADPATLDLLLTRARTHYGWQDRPVSDETLRRLYDIAKMGPTSMNQQPMRLVFVRGAEAKARLAPCLMPANVPKMQAAPVTAIVAYDLAFYERLPRIFPPNPKARDMFAADEEMARSNAFRNGTLQGAWLIIAARAIGLDTGAMSGFDAAKVDEAFFAGTSIRSNFLVNLGHADETKVFRRLPRLDFDEVAEIV